VQLGNKVLTEDTNLRLSAVILRIEVFWVVTPCSVVW